MTEPTKVSGKESLAADPSAQSMPHALTAGVHEAESAVTNWLLLRPRLAALAATLAEVVVKQSYYRLSLSAAGAAFWLVIAVFPAAFAAIMIFGLVVSQEQISAWLDRASQTSPNGLASVVAEQAQQVVQTEPGTLSVGLAVSLGLTLWSASAGAYALLRSIRLAYGLAPQSYLAARARGVLATLVAVVAFGFLGWAGVHASRWVESRDPVAQFALGAVAAVLGFAVLMLVVAATFRFALAMPTPARCLVPGASLTTLAVVLLAAGVALFGSYAARYQATYGALTSMVVTLLVLYGLMYATLLAALFNAIWAPPPGNEVARAGASGEQWQRLSSELDENCAQPREVPAQNLMALPPEPEGPGPPSDTLPQPEDSPTSPHNKQML